MSFITFGDYSNNKSFKVVDERAMRGSSGITMLLGFIAFINGFILQNYIVLPYISGFIALNFLLAIFINPILSPTFLISKLLVRKQAPIYIGAVQKKFAFSLGLILTATIFVLSLMLLKDESLFNSVCMLCLICILFMFLETAFGICVGCKIYKLTLKLKLLPQPKERPNCAGDSCEVE